ncbi:MAG: NAD(P)-dependent oxidoreductase [Muribaculaceae bacterium]|nr:NAD(P)-dependent oxidoreductase [Muribaculaceae bacterium]
MTENLKGKRLLVVGAGGFIGGFIAAEGLRMGMQVTAAVRHSTSRSHLTDPRLEFLVLDYDDPAAVETAIGAAEPWDYIIYNLGATKCAYYPDFRRINFEYLRTFCEALKRTGRTPRRLLFMSSLSALGPGDEKNYTPLSSSMFPSPATRYGQSKIMAEQYLEHMSGIPYIIFRPTGVYGPHEQDYLMMVKCIDRHFDFGVGFRRQMLTFIYVEDLVRAMFEALASGVENRKYIISEDKAYSQKEFRSIVAEALGGKWVVPVRLPLWAAWVASAVAEKAARWQGKTSTLNLDKFKIMKQRNWTCDVSDARRDFGFTARINLREGIRRTVEAYRSAKEQNS